jgi:hypothetical protein
VLHCPLRSSKGQEKAVARPIHTDDQAEAVALDPSIRPETQKALDELSNHAGSAAVALARNPPIVGSPAPAGRAVEGWQDMSSAPKNGDRTPFLAWHKMYGLCSAKWGKEPKDLLFFRQIPSDNYAQVNADGVGWTEHLHDFTGWQPLPAAPTPEGK